MYKKKSLIYLFLTISVLSRSQELPPEINKLFFGISKFNESISLELPTESSLSWFQELSQRPDIYESGIPSATLTISRGNSLEDFNKHLLSFLVNNGYAKIESRTQTKHSAYGKDSKTYWFIFYSDEFKKKLIVVNTSDQWGPIKKTYLKIAHRNLVSIDYKNQYEDAPSGMKRTFYAITFSYNFKSDFLGFSLENRIFKGKAKAFKDPDDGTWKTNGPFDNLGISLSDNGSSEFLRLIEFNYQKYVFKVEQNLAPEIVLDEEVTNEITDSVINIQDNKEAILVSEINNQIVSDFISCNANIYTNKKTNSKALSNVLFLFSVKDWANEHNYTVMKYFQEWVSKSIKHETTQLDKLKEDSLFKVELIFSVKLTKLRYLDAEITTRIYITNNGKLLLDETFSRGTSITMASVELTPVLESAIRNCEKKVSKTFGEYFDIN